MKKILPVLLFLNFLLIGCSSIPQQQAEDIAFQFIQDNVKFFAREQNDSVDLPSYNIGSMDSYQENGNWVVVMHIAATLENETKGNDLTAVIDKKGTVLTLNGRPVPRS